MEPKVRECLGFAEKIVNDLRACLGLDETTCRKAIAEPSLGSGETSSPYILCTEDPNTFVFHLFAHINNKEYNMAIDMTKRPKDWMFNHRKGIIGPSKIGNFVDSLVEFLRSAS